MSFAEPPIVTDQSFDERRARVRGTVVDVAGVPRPAVNGIDNVEVQLVKADDPADDVAVLTVRFIHPLDGRVPGQPPFVSARDVSVRGGDRITQITTLSVTMTHDRLEVMVSPLGDTSTYLLTVDDPTGWLDPLLASVPFSFAIDCATTFDCAPTLAPRPAEPPAPILDYLARDWNSFRQMLLDRMAVTAPEWTERNIADTGVALVELLAHIGDRLTYRQDVVATEAYLDTARRRVSVARHLRLVDHRMHDGAAARVAVQLTVDDEIVVRQGTRFWTRRDGDPVSSVDPNAPELAEAAGAVVFEAAAEVTCRQAHNQIDIHTWTGTLATLPAGSTSVTLRDPHRVLRLSPGDLLMLEQHLDPVSGNRRRPDPTRRHVVRLTSVTNDADPVDDPTTGIALPLVVVGWSGADALPFDLALRPDPRSGLDADTSIAVARGNLVVADHGRTIRTPLPVPVVPAVDEARPRWRYRPALPLRVAPIRPVGARTRIRRTSDIRRELGEASGRRPGEALRRALADAGIALEAPRLFAVADGRWSIVDTATLVIVTDDGTQFTVATMPVSASGLFATDDEATPAITLHRQTTTEVVLDEPGEQWTPLPDLLSASGSTQAFVLEVESDGSQLLRFGDDDHGMAPDPGTRFVATARAGGGRAGNIGADTLAHAQFGTTTQAGTTDRVTIVGDPGAVVAVRNPLPASGGAEPETITDAKVRAPAVFARQLRAVRLDDYARWLEEHPRVQRAVVTRRWTGSWPTLFCTVDLRAEARTPGRPTSTAGTARPALDDDLEAELVAWVEQRRTMGHDIEIDGPDYVPIELHLCVAVATSASRSEVRRQVAARLGSGRVDDRTLGLFHPDARTFGQSVALSQIYAAAQAVPGVLAVDVLALRRQGSVDDLALVDGLLRVGRREIVELQNDPDHPERGVLTIDVEGGR